MLCLFVIRYFKWINHILIKLNNNDNIVIFVPYYYRKTAFLYMCLQPNIMSQLQKCLVFS